MSDSRRIYKISQIEINDTKVVQVVIDPHYELKHSKSINDALVLDLVKELDGRREVPEAKTGRYSYFATLIELKAKKYRLIWLLEDQAIYIGVVNVYRDRRRKK